ncbi:MAG: alpha/beta fold hydrolase [Elusimicrobia bacterium]|nr:alpha/beta fold hydrolase [Elusimicrobiota bacterium]
MKVLRLVCGLLFVAGAAGASDAGAFQPRNAPYGHFGGEEPCSEGEDAVPVVFVHGNANAAQDWDAALADFRAAGYGRCRLYGVTWLSEAERKAPVENLHNARAARILRDFIADVRGHAGSARVDVVAHSMGATQALAAIDAGGLWPVIRRFVAVAAALRGLESCRPSPLKTCAGQLADGSEDFGFLPGDAEPPAPRQTKNWRMGEEGFRAAPRGAPRTRFYSISAGRGDEILCQAPAASGCEKTALFDPAPNVAAQVEVETPGGAAWRHFQVRDLTGPLQAHMLRSDCAGTGCCAPGSASCRRAR